MSFHSPQPVQAVKKEKNPKFYPRVQEESTASSCFAEKKRIVTYEGEWQELVDLEVLRRPRHVDLAFRLIN